MRLDLDWAEAARFPGVNEEDDIWYRYTALKDAYVEARIAADPRQEWLRAMGILGKPPSQRLKPTGRFEYEGRVYIRPMDRGWVLRDADGEPYFSEIAERALLGDAMDGEINVHISIETVRKGDSDA